MKRNNLSILFVTNNYKPYSGGVVSSIDAFRTQLEKEGHRVTVVTLDFTGTPETDPSVVRLWSSLRFIYRGNPCAIPLFLSYTMRAVFDRYKPDIVHIHHPFLLGYAALTIAKKRSIPVVFTYHSQYRHYVRHYIPYFFWMFRWLVDRRVAHVVNAVDLLIVPTQSIKKQLETLYANIHIKVIPTGIASLFVHKILYLKKTKKEFVDLLTVSRFVSEKNLFWLLDMVSQLPDNYRLTLVGYGVLEQSLKIYAYEVLKLSTERVLFVIKPSSKEQLASYYQNADLFVFASHTETQAIVLAESMAAGTPIIALNAFGACDIIVPSENGFLVESEQEMRGHIRMIMDDNNRELYQKLSQGAFTTGQSYHMDVIVQQLLEAYDHCIKNKRNEDA